jgi:hypothetical protein
MDYRDHAPPQFHAIYGESEAMVSIETGEVLEGSLPRRARALVSEWTVLHQAELHRSWRFATASQPLPPIPGLE